MALRQLILAKKITDKRALLEAFLKEEESFTTRRSELEKREADLEAALAEITAETSEEDKNTFEESVKQLETDKAAFDSDVDKHNKDKETLEEEIRKLQAELDGLNEKVKKPATNNSDNKEEPDQRKDDKFYMRLKVMGSVTPELRNSIMAREDVKEFLTRTREFIGQKRAITGGDLLIPNILLELLRDNMHRYSKLSSRVNFKSVGGTARQTIAGTIPEGVWTEAIGKLNEMSLSFNQIEIDGYKVGGYISVYNSLLEDSDINLADEILDAIGQAIGYAVDKAILFGTGTKMPIGISTRLAQTVKPATWGTNAPTWTDLHLTNILTLNPTDLTADEFYADLILKLSVIKSNYTNNTSRFWVMNSKTYAWLIAKALSFNAAGAIVSGQTQTMPIVGGDIIILEFMKDYDIIGGYGGLYLLAERAGAQLAQSEHFRFTDDQTVFKGTARYDGTPVFGEGFVLVNINNAAPTTTATFATDTANA